MSQHFTMDFSWQDLHTISDLYGPSFYLLDPDRFLDNFIEFRKAFQSCYQNSIIAYSYKANYLPILCQSINEAGGYAEVASSLEYELARHIGVPGTKIIFNGPYKTRADLELALFADAIVNLDSTYEVEMVLELAQRHPVNHFKIGLRCNFPLDTGAGSRFGFETDRPEFSAVVDRINRTPNCSIGGLQCHFHFPQRDLKSYALVTRMMADLVRTLFPNPEGAYLDLGGGFYSKMSAELGAQFPGPVPTWQEYADAITSELAEVFPAGASPTLIVEPGMALVADTMKFVAQVVDIKTSSRRIMALVAASVYNVNPNRSNRKLPIKVVRQKSPNSEPHFITTAQIDLVGYTCMEADSLYEGYSGSLQVGDFIVFGNVGAYSIVLKPPFILPAPPVLSIERKTGEHHLHRRPEAFRDIFATFSF